MATIISPLLQPTSNIRNKVRNTNLPKTKALHPLFEVISNSIHAIKEAKKSNTSTPAVINKAVVMRLLYVFLSS